MRVCVIFNPAARGDKARLFQQQLVGVSGECALKPTTHAGAARELAALAVGEGFDTIVAAGGDGTVNEVLNGIADARGFTRARLGVLPLGTANVFAKELGLPEDFTGAWEVVRRGKELCVDAPFVEDGANGRRYFVQMAGAGLDSRAIELTDWELKKKIGWLAYVVAGFKAMAGPLPDLEVACGGQRATGKVVMIGNGKFYGGRFAIFPRADLADGELEVVVYPQMNAATVARAGWGMVSGDFHLGAGTVQMRGPQVEVRSSAPVPFHVDGENVGSLPARFSLEPRAVRVLVP